MNLQQNPPSTPSTSSLVIDAQSRRYLLETAGWGKFISIVMFILLGIWFLLLILIPLLGGMDAFSPPGSPMMKNMDGDSGDAFALLLIILLMAIYGLLIGLPAYYLWKYSTRIKRALTQNNQHLLTEGFQRLLFLFRFYGILTLISVGIYVLTVGLLIIFGIIAAVN